MSTQLAWRRVWLKADNYSRGGQQSREAAVCVLHLTLFGGSAYPNLGLAPVLPPAPGRA